jgi:hypothetical protein
VIAIADWVAWRGKIVPGLTVSGYRSCGWARVERRADAVR